MPLKLASAPGLLSLQPWAQEVEANRAPVINTYGPEVEKWRQQAWDEMPPQLKQRPDAATLLDKYLYVVKGESGGNDKAVGDGGAAWGLGQSHHIPVGSDSTTQLQDIWRMVANNPDQWTDWGEGATYEGKPFGALGRAPYNGGSGGNVSTGVNLGSAGTTPVNFTKPRITTPDVQQLPQFDTQGQPAITQPDSQVDTQGLPAVENPVVTPNMPNLSGFAPGASSGMGGSGGGGTTGNLQTAAQGIAERGNPLSLYGQANVDVPYVSDAIRSAKPYIERGTDMAFPGQEAAVNLLNKGSSVVGGPHFPTMGEGVAANTPTGALDLAVTAAPFVKPAITGARGAVEASALRGLEPRPSNVLDFPGGRPLISQVRTPSIAGASDESLSLAQKQYQQLRAAGYTDDQIAQTFGQQAVDAGKGGIDTTAQTTARIQVEQDAKGAAAKRVWNKAFDVTHDVDFANSEARKAAAKAPEALPEQKPNVLATDETRQAMQNAMEQARSDQPSPGYTRLYRGDRGSIDPNLPDWQKVDAGRWFTDNKELAQAYGPVHYVDVPTADAAQYHTTLGGRAEGEYLLPPELANTKAALATDEMQQVRDRSRNPQQEAGQSNTEQMGAGDATQEQQQMAGEGTEEYRGKSPSSSENQPLSEEDIFKQANEAAIAKKAESLGVNPEELNPRDRAAATAEVLDRLQKAKPGQSVEDVLTPKAATQSVSEIQAAKAARGGGRYTPEESARLTELRQGGPAADRMRQQSLQQALESMQGKDFGATGEAVQGEVPKGTVQQTALPGIETPPGTKLDSQGGIQPVNSKLPPHEYALKAVGEVLSSPFRFLLYGHEPILKQGKFFALTNRSEAWQALKDMATIAKNPEARKEIQARLNNLPFNRWAIDQGLSKEYQKPLQTVVNDVIDHILGMVNSSESAQGYLESLRKLGFESQAQRDVLLHPGRSADETVKALTDIWNTVGDATGHGVRGGSPGGFNPFFSRQAFAGRLRFFSDPFTQSGSANPLSSGARAIAIREWLSMASLTGTVYGLSAATGNDLNWDLMKTPLGKVQLGESTIDPTGGIQSIVRAGMGISNAILSGKPEQASSVVTQYLRGQLGPPTETALTLLTGQDWSGRQPKLTEVAARLFTPIALRAIMDAVKGNGPIGALIAAPSLGAMDVQTNTLQAARNRESRQQFNKDYADLLQTQKDKIDASTSVKSEMPEPSDIKQGSQDIKAKYDQQENGAIDQFKADKLAALPDGTPVQSMPDAWMKLGLERRAAAEQFQKDNKDTLSGIPENDYKRVTEPYYSEQNIVKQLNGAIDFDATAAKRQDYIDGLSDKPNGNGPSDKAIMQDALLRIEGNKSDAHQKYDKYIAARKAAGYFNIAPDDPKANEKRLALDKANPLQDALNWYWKGGTANTQTVPTLNTAKGVDIALQMAPNRPVNFGGLSRPINQSQQSIAAWQEYGPRIDSYFNNAVPTYRESVAKELFSGQPGFRDYSSLDAVNQGRVNSNILSRVKRDNPELEAALQYFGHTKDADGRYTVSSQAGQALQQIIAKYGGNPPQPGTLFAVRN